MERRGENRWWLLHPCPLSGAYRACLLPSSKLQKSLLWPAACSIHSSLGKGQCSCKLWNKAARWPLLQGFVHILGTAESGACLSHLLCCSAGLFRSEGITPCKCCNTCVGHSLRHLRCSTSFYIFAFLQVQYSIYLNCFTCNFCIIISLKIKLLQILKNRGIKKKIDLIFILLQLNMFI